MRSALAGVALSLTIGATAPAAAQTAAETACLPPEFDDRRPRCPSPPPSALQALEVPPFPAGTPGAGLRPSAPAWVAWAGGALAFGHLLVLDPSVRRTALEARGPVTGDFAAIGRWVGDWQASLPVLAGGALAVGLGTEGAAGLRDVAALLGGIVAGSMANEAINQTVGRSRPLEEDGSLAFDPFEGHASFPSGHTAFAFSIAGAVDAVTEGWAPAAAGYGIATVTGLSRMYDDKHWLTDVVVGAAVGTFVSRLAAGRTLRWLGDEDDVARGPEGGKAAARPPSLRPIVTARTIGLELRF